MPKITNVITLAQYANKHGLDVKRLRRLARKSEWPIDPVPFKFGGKNGIWCIDADAPAVELPVKSTRGTRRVDGRQRYIVFINTHVTSTEHDAIAAIVGIDNIIDPRVASRERRAARKLDVDAAQIIADAHDIANALENELLTDARENDVNE
jgi:hypothetical protein